ncbi:MAG: glucokinase [Chthoniobacterales bacterium]|nr:glucokinase [Chthoniobacterales bacterium]
MRPLPDAGGATILAADVGGTKTWLATFRADGIDSAAPLTMQRASKYSSRAAASLEQLIKEFLEDELSPVDFACFGLPGPVAGTRAKLVNLPWEIDAASLSAAFGFRGCFLINDLVANAYGIGELRPADFALLHRGSPGASGNMAVISPGTGLGEAGIFWDGRKHVPFACEGGHCDFAPRTELELALHQHLLHPYGHISFERVLSGSMGIPNIYNFLRDTGRVAETPAVAELLKAGDPGAVISAAAADASCPLCVQTMEIFTTILGAEAGNLALKIMATGGVFIGGGIAAKILPLLQRPPLLEAFFAKGRFSDFMQRIPLRVILNDRAALLGAARYALHGAEQMRPRT